MNLNNDEFACLMARFASNKVVMYRQRHNYHPSLRQRLQSEVNLEKKTYNGYMSKNTKSYVTKILDLWYMTSKYWNRYYSRSNQASKKKLTFVTLTLPSKQRHTDNEIKRKCLNFFIIASQRSGIFDHYFWRAEKQANGNIHFHLLVDRFIPMEILQKCWCKAVNVLGYVDEYQIKFGEKLPPCTHIAEIPTNQNIIDYVVKYVGKNESDQKVEGRIWGMSDQLRNLLAPCKIVDNSTMSQINKFVKDDCKNVYQDENCTVVRIDFCDRQKYEMTFRSIILDEFFKANCSYLYFNGFLPIDQIYPKTQQKTRAESTQTELKSKWDQLSFDFENNL